MNSTAGKEALKNLTRFRLGFDRIPQKIPLAWAEDPSAKRLLAKNEWLTGLKGRLPRHYVNFYKEWEKGPQAFIHDLPIKANFEKDEFGNVRRFQQPRIPVLYPDEFHQGLWGGEGLVKGGEEPEHGKHNPQYKPARESYWMPKLHFSVTYSEILDKHIEVVMTERAERLIDECFGLDSYLLKTPVNEIYSHFGLKLKRELLLTLANADEELYPLNAEKRKQLLSKYQEFIWPLEVADFHGLPLQEALHKQHTLDRLEEEKSIKPLKEKYRQEMLELLESGTEMDFETDDPEASEKSGFFSKFTSR